MTGPASRRGFLRGLTAFSAGAALMAPSLVEAAAPPLDGDLLKLGQDLTRALRVLAQTEEAMAWAVEHFESIKPPIPEDLKLSPFAARWVGGEWPPDALGRCNAGEVRNSIRIPDQYDLDRIVRLTDGRTVLGKRARRIKKISEAFHTAHEEARKAAGLPHAAEQRYYAMRTVVDIGFAIMAVDAKTLAGLSVKGRAGIAMHRAWAVEGSHVRAEPSYASLCANLAALDPEGAALCA